MCYAGWTTFPNQRTQYPAQVRVEVYNQCPSLSERSADTGVPYRPSATAVICLMAAVLLLMLTSSHIAVREFRPLLKDCYSQDTSQSSRLCFELKRSEAQNLCRLFNAASARVNLGVGATRTPARPAASGSKASGGAAPSSQAEASTSDVSHCFVAFQLK